MTTIAWDGKTVAADGQMTSGDRVIHQDFPKVLRLSNGALMAGAGAPEDLGRFYTWFEEGCEGYVKLSKNTEILYVDKHGARSYVGNTGCSVEVQAPYGMGTGGPVAVGAMLAGKSAAQAVRIAAQVDIYTNDIIRSMAPKK